jgi:hypothetical protein
MRTPLSPGINLLLSDASRAPLARVKTVKYPELAFD